MSIHSLTTNALFHTGDEAGKYVLFSDRIYETTLCFYYIGFDGDVVGWEEGCTVVGVAVDGLDVGIAVDGLAVGDLVGFDVGLGVGDGVGLSVGQPFP